jgi:hypothetical protein
MTIIDDVNARAVHNDVATQTIRNSVLDKARLGEIRGALGNLGIIAGDLLLFRTFQLATVEA